jgi:hypothetical protein
MGKKTLILQGLVKIHENFKEKRKILLSVKIFIYFFFIFNALYFFNN